MDADEYRRPKNQRNVDQRAHEAFLELRGGGMDAPEIATKTGWSVSVIQDWWNKSLSIWDEKKEELHQKTQSNAIFFFS